MKAKKTKKTNSYKNGLKIIAVAMVIGGVAGGISGGLYEAAKAYGIGIDMAEITALFQSVLAPLQAIIFAASVILGETSHRRLKAICEKQQTAEDEECDRLEYEEEKEGAFGMNTSVVSQVLCILFLTFGYSMKYITGGGHAFRFLAACTIFIACFVYEYFWQIRYVKLIQKNHPESCDEAEKEIIYRSSYKAFMTVNRTVPILLVGTMVAHLYFDTGMFAVVVVSIIWLVTQFTYARSCVRLRETRTLVR